jgi:hypothetical protein
LGPKEFKNLKFVDAKSDGQDFGSAPDQAVHLDRAHLLLDLLRVDSVVPPGEDVNYVD